MDVEELDLPPSAMADRISQPKFNTVRRGYDPGQVLEYLTRVADHVQVLEGRVGELESELKVAHEQGDKPLENQTSGNETRERIDPIEAASARVTELIKAFDRDVGGLHREAEAEAARIVDEARSEAERIGLSAQGSREETQAEAAAIVDEARGEADGIRLEASNQAEEVRAASEQVMRDARAAAAQVMQDARNETERDLAGLKSDREGVLNELKLIRDGLLATIRRLAAIDGSGSGLDPVAISESDGEVVSVPPHV